MEDLTKHQIVLLTLFVSFVTSIATGIFTVSLMDKAPQSVVQTINRVVERTIQTVGSENSSTTAVMSDKVAEDPLTVSGATAKALRGTVLIYKKLGIAEKPYFVGLGAVVAKNGIVVTDRANLAARAKYVVVQNGNEFPVTDTIFKDGTSLAYLNIGAGQNGTALSKQVAFATDASIALGLDLIMLQGSNPVAVHQGIIQALKASSDTAMVAGTTITEVVASFDQKASLPTSLIFNLRGELVGIKTSDSLFQSLNLFVPASIVKASIPVFQNLPLSVDTTPKAPATAPDEASSSPKI
jgi:hypothetical protein